jgi:hypothetical protein
MTSIGTRQAWTRVLAVLLAVGAGAVSRLDAQTITVENHHELEYAGPVTLKVELPEGSYAGGQIRGEVRGGEARLVGSFPAGSEAVLTRTGALADAPFRAGALSVSASPSALALGWQGRGVGTLELGLAAIPDTTATSSDAIRGFHPLSVTWHDAPGGVLRGEATQDGYRVQLEAAPYGGGWMDLRARVTREGGSGEPSYLALVRRVTTPGISGGKHQLNGRVIPGVTTFDTWVTDFRYVHQTDWVSWKSGGVSFLNVNGFAPVPTIQRPDSSWATASHWYVWERSQREGDQVYLVSEISGPNAHQTRRGATAVSPYAALRVGDTVSLKSRLAVAEAPGTGWEESQLRVFAGYRLAHEAPNGSGTVVDLGVPSVLFGTAYMPYSTFTENFDYYRVPGQDQETYWPISPTMWAKWREFIPRMRTDMHIARAMGFEMLRPHHMELLQKMDRAESLAFLDFYMDQARQLGMKVMLDTEGPADWVAFQAKRYGDVIARYEIENEIVIQGVRPGSAERWTSLLNAARAADPTAQAFLTGAGNNDQFERMRELGVPIDRVGLHAYKHGPEWPEAFSSHVLGTAGYAADHGKEVTLGEFNWKELTRLSPEARRSMVETIYHQVLRPRAIPELVEFHLQETLSVNPSIQRQGIRHYEPLNLDRTPKPEGLELMQIIRANSAADAPVRELPVEISEVKLVNGRAAAPFQVTNHTGHAVSVRLAPESFGGLKPRLTGASTLRLAAGETARGTISLRLPAGAKPGAYHHFLKVDYGEKTAWGWGVASNPGAPRFDAPVIPEHVVYPQGAEVVKRIDWTKPLAVAFGKDASVLELEMAYEVGQTLQAAIGRPVRISSTADLPAATAEAGTLILVGTPETNPMIETAPAGGVAGKGTVFLRTAPNGAQHLLLTGADKAAVEAAASDFVLRYWPHAKDSAIGRVGKVKGAALGNRAGVGAIDQP